MSFAPSQAWKQVARVRSVAAILILASSLAINAVAQSSLSQIFGQQTSGGQTGSAGAQSSDQSGGTLSIGGSGNQQTLPSCSDAEPGQPCVKDVNGDARTSGSASSPSITSTADDLDGPIRPDGTITGSATPPQQTSGTTGGSDRNTSNPDGQRQQNLKQESPLEQDLATAPNPFQTFVARSVGTKLPLFGYDLFRNPPTTFAPADQIPVTADYVIGPGDQIVVRAWGAIDINYKATVDRNGSIFLPKVGEIPLAGVRYADLTNYIRARIARIFRNFDLEVGLGRLRSIQVLVVGQANRPGTYTISSLSTLVSALFASGGPNTRGSLRHLQLKRNNALVADFDVYDLLIRGDKSKDVPVLSGDVIYIPPVGPLVAISGLVNNPAIYELKGETSLGDLVALAGGLSTTAEGKHVSLERIDNRSIRQMAEFQLDAQGLSQPVKDGDLVKVFPVTPQFENAVTLRGNVAVPGRYPWHQGMRIKDLIPSRTALVTREYWQRLNSAAIASTRGQEQLRNEIERTAPEINWDYAVIQRLRPNKLASDLITFNLGKAVDGDPESNVELQPGDVITIFSQADIRVPILQQSKYVRLEGEMNTAGVYKAQPGETLRHLVQRIGGLSPNAYLYGAQLLRESTRVEQQARLDLITERFSQDVERSASRKSQNLTNPADAVSLQANVDSQRRLAERLKQVRATGRIVLNIKPNDAAVSNLPDLTLEDGDRLVVPYRPSTVSVLGAVYDQADFVFRPGLRVSDYLKQAGGTTRTGDRRRIYIIRANGSVSGQGQAATLFSGGIMGERLNPGDAIVVPEQINKTTLTRNLLDYSQILSQFGLGVAAIKVLAP